MVGRLSMAAILSLLLVAASSAVAADLTYVYNASTTDTLLMGTPTRIYDTGYVAVVALNVNGAATDTMTVADSLKIGAVSATRAKRAVWKLQAYFSTGASDTMTRTLALNYTDNGGTRRTQTFSFDTSVADNKAWTTLTLNAVKVWRAVAVGKAASDSMAIRAYANAPRAIWLDDTNSLTRLRYFGLAQETILPQQRGAVGLEGELWAKLASQAKPGFVVIPNRDYRKCTAQWAVPDSGYIFGTVKSIATAAGLAQIWAFPLYRPGIVLP